MDSNRGPLVSKVTAIPNEPQLLSIFSADQCCFILDMNVGLNTIVSGNYSRVRGARSLPEYDVSSGKFGQ